MQIMYGIEHTSQYFSRAVEVMKISAAEIAAGIASATGIEWMRIGFVDGILDLEIAIAGK